LSDPATLDWNRAHTPIETHLLVNLMEGLLSLDSQLRPTPALAEKWKISPDGQTYTFQLRKGVKWSDGVPLKASDFVQSWKRLLTPSTAATYAYLLFDIVGAEEFYLGKIKEFNQVGVRARDDLTLEVKLKHRVAHWINIPSFWVTFPIRQDVIEKYPSSWDRPGRMVTVGPFTLASHELDSKIVLKPNPYYYRDRGNITEVDALVIRDDATALKLYETGKLDFLIDLSSTELTRLAGRSDLKRFPYLKTVYLGFVVDKAPTSQIQLRKSIASAVNKSKLTELLQGGQTPASSFVPPPLLGSSTKIGPQFETQKLQTPLQLDLLLLNLDKSLLIGQWLQGELKKRLGIDLILQPFDHKSYRTQLNSKKFPIFLASWSADFPDPDNFLSIFSSTSGNNRTNWKSVVFDTLLQKGRHLQNSSEREKLYVRMQKLLVDEEKVIIPLYYEPNLALIRSRVRNLELNPLNYLHLRKVNLD
jgi:oligopeptide transport system substrate-binding protein